MRDYAKVAPSFWTGRTGRALRGNAEAQIVAMYLMTCPHANMIGVFTCPLIYIAHETGLPLEGASKGLQSLIEAGFCSYEADLELVWVHEMARFQIGDSLKPTDNRTAGVRNEYDRIPRSLIRQGFHARYRHVYHLLDEVFEEEKTEAPSKPLVSQEQEQEIEQEQEQDKSSSSSNGSTTPRVNPPPLPPVPEPSEQAQRIGLVCRLLRSKGVTCSPGQFAGKYQGLENHSDDDFHLAVQTLIDRGETSIGIGLVAAVLGDITEGRRRPGGSPRKKPAVNDLPTSYTPSGRL
jgi:hypothetical protein